jgi:hypothetical protein
MNANQKAYAVYRWGCSRFNLALCMAYDTKRIPMRNWMHAGWFRKLLKENLVDITRGKNS